MSYMRCMKTRISGGQFGIKMVRLSVIIFALLMSVLSIQLALVQAESVDHWLGRAQSYRANPENLHIVLEEAVSYYAKIKKSLSSGEKDGWKAFINLAKVKPENQCSPSTSELLKTALNQLGIDPHRMTVSNVGWLLHDLVYASMSHECKRVHSENYEKYMIQMQKSDADLLYMLFDAFKYGFGVSEEVELYPGAEEYDKLRSEISQGDMAKVASALREVAPLFDHGESEKALLESVTKAQTLCAKYVSATGQTLEAAKFHAETVMKSNYGDLAEGFVTLRICEGFSKRNAKDMVAAIIGKPHGNNATIGCSKIWTSLRKHCKRNKVTLMKS